MTIKPTRCRSRRAFLAAVAVVSLTGSAHAAPPAAAVALFGGCPEVKSGAPGTAGEVVERYFDAFGCEIPLRRGHEVGGDRWGFEHIEHRCKMEGEVNHCLDGAQRRRISATLTKPTLKCARQPPRQSQLRYYLHFQDGARNRTMVVIAERAGYQGLGPQGIRTAYWERSHRKGCS